MGSNGNIPDTNKVNFTRSGDVWIAYQVIGDGPIDVIFSIGWLTSFRSLLNSTLSAAFFEKLSRKCRLILFDKRGTGMSDRDVGIATLEDRADDIRAVLDAAGSDNCTVIGFSEGANISAMFAATYPERTRSLILLSCSPCVAWKPDWQDGFRRAEFEQYKSDLISNWGTPVDLERLAPSVASDPNEQESWTNMLLDAANPASAQRMAQMWYQMDIRQILPTIHLPSLVLHRRDETAVPIAHGRIVAELLPQGKLVELDGIDHVPWYGDAESIVEEIHRFLPLETTEPKSQERKLLSILVTDIVGSSLFARELGDSEWSNWTATHFENCRKLAADFGGNLVKTMGDGTLISFSGPSAAIECALQIKNSIDSDAAKIRMGIHTGECIQQADDLSGIAINLAVRIMDKAAPSQLLASSTVKDLAFGSNFEFLPHGPYKLKGFDGDWNLFEVS
ncbi:MAG: adenylate/guanylate cyclase domain-containing protein [Rhizobiaceae bacterium]